MIREKTGAVGAHGGDEREGYREADKRTLTQPVHRYSTCRNIYELSGLGTKDPDPTITDKSSKFPSNIFSWNWSSNIAQKKRLMMQKILGSRLDPGPLEKKNQHPVPDPFNDTP